MWRDFIRELCVALSPEEAERLRDNVIGRATDVADAAGGLLGLVARISAEERAGIFYVSPASRYSFSHPQSTGHADSPFHAIWFCGGWASDKERRRAMRALKPLRQSGRVECFRSAAMLKRRGHFAKRSE